MKRICAGVRDLVAVREKILKKQRSEVGKIDDVSRETFHEFFVTFAFSFFVLYSRRMKTKTEKQVVGKIGEDIAVKFLVKQGFTVVERNYLKKFGEIDVVCRQGGKWHFVEVKTVSVSRETSDDHRPEENVHVAKQTRIGRTIQVYLNENDSDDEWEFHVVGVVLNTVKKTARVRFLKDIIIEGH